jgi:hypothetical protein
MDYPFEQFDFTRLFRFLVARVWLGMSNKLKLLPTPEIAGKLVEKRMHPLFNQFSGTIRKYINLGGSTQKL